MGQRREAASSTWHWDRFLQETQHHFVRREWGKVVLAAEQGLALHPLGPDAEGRLRFYAGAALLHVGDLLRAEKELLRFCRLARKSPQLKRLEGDGLLTLARLMQLLDRPQREESYWRRAIVVLEAQGRIAQSLACRQNLAWSLLVTGRVTEALPELNCIERQLDRHGYPELHVDYTTSQALYHSMEGKTETSDGLCLSLMQRADLSDRQAADLAWILGANALAQGNWEDAVLYASRAEAAAVRHWWPPQLYRVQVLINRIKHQDGQGQPPA